MVARVTRVTITAGFALATFAASLHVACTGSDPVLTVTPGASSDVDASMPTIFGVFLTSTTFHPNFGESTDPGGLAALVDGFCSAHAADAGVPNPGDYHAIIALGTNRDPGEGNRLLQAADVDASAPMWCRLAATAPPRVNCDLGPIFRNVADFQSGPRQNIFTDEHGLLAPQALYKGVPVFLSGYALLEGQNVLDGVIRNCDQWRNQLDADIPTGTDTSLIGPEYGFGVGSARAVAEGDGVLRWLGNDFAFCEPHDQFPILCIETPRR